MTIKRREEEVVGSSQREVQLLKDLLKERGEEIKQRIKDQIDDHVKKVLLEDRVRSRDDVLQELQKGGNEPQTKELRMGKRGTRLSITSR